MDHLIACGEPLYYRTGNMAFCSGAGIKPRRCRRSGPKVGAVGEGNQGIVGDESGVPSSWRCHVWTAPADQGFFCGVAFDRGCGHAFGLSMWVLRPAGPDVVR
jgi:hypothetical protein